MSADDSATERTGADRVPRLTLGANVLALPLSPTEGFILSRVDGSASLQEIADSTGAGIDLVMKVIAMLEESSMVEWVPLPEAPRARSRRRSRQRMKTPAQAVVHTRPAPEGTPRRLYDPAELEEEGVELDRERRRQILDTFYGLEELDLYELLGLEPEAAKADIRSAYFKLSKVFHTDTVYGKELGSYKSKMDAVFRRLTEAYEVLGKKRTRKEYDNYIKLKRRTRGERWAIARGAEDARRAETNQAAGSEKRAVVGAVVTESKPAPARSVPPTPAASVPPAPRPPPPAPAPSRPMSEEGKDRARRLVARRLSAAARRAPAAKATNARRHVVVSPARLPNPPSSTDVLRGLAGSLKQASGHTGGVDRAAVHLGHARDAEASGNLVAAVNALRLAVALSDERPEVVAEYDRVRHLHASEMAESYEKQAKYEERTGKWAEAALSWSRVCEGRPDDALAHMHAAVALLEADGDMAQAKRFGERAKVLDPDNPLHRRALGRIYSAMGMKLNAKRELEAFLKKHPNDDEMKKLLKAL